METINIGTLVVKGLINVNICGRVKLILKPVQIPSFMCSGTTIIELREFNDKKKKNNMDEVQKLI